MNKKYFLTILTVFILFATQVFSEEITGDVFGKQRRNIHPAVGLSFQYTDNLYNSNTDEESDFSTVFSPSIAFALPGTRDVDIVMNTDTGVPGGLSLSRDRVDSTERYLAYLIYNPKGEYYFDNDDENFISHSVKGLAQYNARGGFSVDLAGRYASSRETRGEVGDRESDEYEDFLLDMILKYDITPKLFFKAQFARYDIEYDEVRSNFRNRTDSSWGVSSGYKLGSKSDISLEYRYTDVEYEEDILADNDEKSYSVNFDWDMTAKTKGKIKVGKTDKSLDSGKDSDDFFTEIDLRYDFTTRTRLNIAGSRKYYESNFTGADFYTADKLALIYEQEFATKLTAKVNLVWSHDDYSGADIESDTYMFNPSVKYDVKDWFYIDLGYSLETRDSDLEILDYDTNSVYMSFNGQF